MNDFGATGETVVNYSVGTFVTEAVATGKQNSVFLTSTTNVTAGIGAGWALFADFRTVRSRFRTVIAVLVTRR